MQLYVSFDFLHLLKSLSQFLVSHAAFPDIAPARLQHFEYKRISLNCEGFDGSFGWRAMRKIHKENTKCGMSWGILKESLCTIRDVYKEDSGEYWCENADGKKSNMVNITITGTVGCLKLLDPTVYFLILWFHDCVP